jgi:hypothetical protein
VGSALFGLHVFFYYFPILSRGVLHYREMGGWAISFIPVVWLLTMSSGSHEEMGFIR